MESSWGHDSEQKSAARNDGATSEMFLFMESNTGMIVHQCQCSLYLPPVAVVGKGGANQYSGAENKLSWGSPENTEAPIFSFCKFLQL